MNSPCRTCPISELPSPEGGRRSWRCGRAGGGLRLSHGVHWPPPHSSSTRMQCWALAGNLAVGLLRSWLGIFCSNEVIDPLVLRLNTAHHPVLCRFSLRIRTCYGQFLRTVSCWYRTRPLPIDPFPVRRPPKPPRVFFTRRTFAHAFSQKHTTLIPRTSPPASLPRRDMSNPGQLSSR